MGERRDEKDPALRILKLSVADLLCLRGDVEGCLAASREAGRELAPYRGLLGPGQSLRPAAFEEGKKFLVELHRVSKGWDRDPALVSEGLGLLEQATGDHLRMQAHKAGWRKFRMLFGRASAKGCPDPVGLLIQAGELSELMLDHEKTARVGEALLIQLRRRAYRYDGDLARLKRTLERATAALTILGREEQAEKTRKVAARLEAKALTPPDLSFELTPFAGRFKCNLAKAERQLLRLARRAPLRSRASVMFFFLAGYAGVLSNSPGAAAELANIQETLGLTDPYLAARVRGLRGRGALLTGDFHRAGRLLTQAARELPGKKPSRLKGLLLANAAQAGFYLGHYRQSAATYLRAAAASREAETRALSQLGAAHALTFAGELEKARVQLEKAERGLAGVPAGRRDRHLRALRLDRALWLLAGDREEEALALFGEVAQEARLASDLRAAVVALTNLAEIHNDRGESQQALTRAESALKWLNPGSQADAAWQAWCEKGRALVALGNQKAAARSFERAMDLVERLRSLIGAEGSRRSFAAAKTRLYRAAVALQVATRNPQEAFRISERARSRAFLDMLGERRLVLGDARQQERLGPSRERMLASLPPLELSIVGPGAGLNAETGNTRKADARPRPDPRKGWLSLVTVNPATVGDVRRRLDQGESLVSFFHDGERLHVFWIDDSGVRVHSVEVGEKKLANRVRSFLRVLQRPRRGARRLQKKSGRLYRLLFEPLMKPGIGKLTVVPWGPLHYLPFMALWDGQAYLVDRVEALSVAPSASVFVMLNTPAGGNPGRVLALGNPVSDLPDLPSAAREVKLVQRLFNSARVHTGRRASKSAFLKNAPGAGLIHVASHGVFLPDRPMDSYLALAGPRPEAGRLTAREILELDLGRAGLVVLSACDTGRTRVQKGDEIIGLSRAFLHAGADSLVASLWPLSDQAAVNLIGDFYRALNQGNSPAASLTQSVRKLKKNPRYAHPFFWAPFELIGN